VRPIEIITCFEYHYWAFERVWECVMQLTDDQFAQDLGYSTGSIRGIVLHTWIATQRWIDRMECRPLSPQPRPEEYPTRASVKAQWDAARDDARGYLNTLTEAKLSQNVHWELSNRGMVADQPLWQVLLHVFNHTTDHRAQLLALLHQHFHLETPEQDMLFYLVEAANQPKIT